MNLCEQLNKEMGINEGVNTTDGLERLIKKLKGKTKEHIIIGEQVAYGDNSEYQEISSDLRKIDKSINGLTATTDTEYTDDNGAVDDDGEESSDTNYYAFSMPEGDIGLEEELKKLDKKYSFYGVWINGKKLEL